MGATSYSKHMQNVALALFENGALGAFYTGFVDNYGSAYAKTVRSAIKRTLPALDRGLSRRKITLLPDEVIHKSWSWEVLRSVAQKARAGACIEDWLWEKSEERLDAICSRLIRGRAFDAFLGVEHGALGTIRAARESGKKSVITFLSPHHAFREKWVDAEYKAFPELLTPSAQRLLHLGIQRDRRRDEEAKLADIIRTNSSLTSASLADAGFDPGKMVTVPPGGPHAISEEAIAPERPGIPRFIYAGPVSVRKGAHYLIKAWKLLKPRNRAELHFYGTVLLPKRCLEDLGGDVLFHGTVPQDELFSAFREGCALVFPTLCDGFGMVACEAMAQGLPVITTKNAGARDAVREGENGFVVPVRDERMLAERMEWFMQNRKELPRMRRAALAGARERTWERFRTHLWEELTERIPFG
jgi:glycosyltransferase involved in cell wall biosynthesis